MDITEVAQRVIWRHKLLIVVIVVLCVGGGLAVNRSQSPGHSATARISIGGTAQSNQSAIATKSASDTALAIVTSRQTVADALKSAGANRDAATFATGNVTLVPVGTSNVVDLTVTDPDAHVAQGVTDALARSLLVIEQRVSGGSNTPLVNNLTAQVEQSSRRVADLQSAIAAAGGPGGASAVYTTQLANAQRSQHDLQLQHDKLQAEIVRQRAPANAAAEVTGLNAQLDAVIEQISQIKAAQADAGQSQTEQQSLLNLQLTSTLQEQAVLRSDRQRLVETQATVAQPVVLQGAKLAPTPKSKVASTVVLAFILGVVLALAVAAVLETLRPTVVGADALARVLGSSVLGTLSGTKSSISAGEVKADEAGALAGMIRLASNAKGISRVELVAADKLDLGRLAVRLGDQLVTSPEVSVFDAAASSLPASFAAKANGRGSASTGMVVVAPAKSKRSALDDVSHLQEITGWPLLGVVTYDRVRKPKDRKTEGRAQRAADLRPVDSTVAKRSSVPTG